MNCPKCNYKKYCPCKHCKDKLPKNMKAWIWIDGDLVKCANCGETAHVDRWEMNQGVTE